jgi:hypothetical protein
MHATLPLVALATGVALPSPLRAVHEALVNGGSVAGPAARGWARRPKVVLPERLQEEVRIVGALAELFATAAAEHLMNAGLTGGSDAEIYRESSSRRRRDAMRPTLPLIALAAGAALCSPMLAQPATARGDRSAGVRPHRFRRGVARGRRSA